jgi:hypothetical protein
MVKLGVILLVKLNGAYWRICPLRHLVGEIEPRFLPLKQIEKTMVATSVILYGFFC